MEASHKRRPPHIKVGTMRKKKNVDLYLLILILRASKGNVNFHFRLLGPPVPLGASGDEKPPSITVTGDPAGPMPADTHLFYC